jgi:transketolase
MALAAKMDGSSYKTFVLMGDGEQGEGSVYEAAMAANHYKLDNLVAVIDRNDLQISGNTEDIMALENMQKRWLALGWDVRELNGDIIEDIVSAFDMIDYSNNRPHLLISHTTKGKGVSYMEGLYEWHHKIPDSKKCQQALEEISTRINKIVY